ncbi:MAG: M17 family peptidase N-terminal domain-containing protein [Polyangiaceae bacterium]|nr:M17 family peptidase N-terminal domain-containing protein [Polyangiaceae bacterium]
MDLRFIAPSLRSLDVAGTEVLVAPLSAGERPPGGVTGLLDWRFSGRICRLIREGFATGEVGEVLLLPGKPKLPFDKVVLFGIGSPESFSELIFRATIRRILETLEGLRARSAVVELPGRHFQGILPEQAADILLEMVGANPLHDVWTLLEPADAQRAISQHMIQERRRLREDR